MFDPVLDALEDHSKQLLAKGAAPEGEYETEYPLRVEFFRKVKARGLDLRFGASTAVTTVFLMAPLCAGFAVLLLIVLIGRGVPERRALWLVLLFTFGTPLFYRSVSLSHNAMVMCAAFGSFLCLWPRAGVSAPLSSRRLFWAGMLGGSCLALDYAGVVILLCLFGYLLVTQARSRGRCARGHAVRVG